MCCPIGRPKTEVDVRSSNLNFATLWLNCVRLTSLKSLKFWGSKQPVRTPQGEQINRKAHGKTRFVHQRDIKVQSVVNKLS